MYDIMKYFLYARKSTDEPDRQLLSIEAQLAELREFARKEFIRIIDEFTESRTAKEPGRPVFSEMMDLLEERKKRTESLHGILIDWPAIPLTAEELSMLWILAYSKH